jgi:hypothetical protein
MRRKNINVRVRATSEESENLDEVNDDEDDIPNF